MRPLEKFQRTKLEALEIRMMRTKQEVWALLSPSYERDTIMLHILNAQCAIKNMLSEPEQMTMEEFLNEDSKS